MPKYLVQGSYTNQGLKGLLKEGGSKRPAMVEQLAKEMGGMVKSRVTVLMTPEEVDQAVQRKVDFRPPE